MLMKNGIEYLFDCLNRFEVVAILLRKSHGWLYIRMWATNVKDIIFLGASSIKNQWHADDVIGKK